MSIKIIFEKKSPDTTIKDLQWGQFFMLVDDKNIYQKSGAIDVRRPHDDEHCYGAAVFSKNPGNLSVVLDDTRVIPVELHGKLTVKEVE